MECTTEGDSILWCGLIVFFVVILLVLSAAFVVLYAF